MPELTAATQPVLLTIAIGGSPIVWGIAHAAQIAVAWQVAGQIASTQSQALAMRATWMRRLGMSEEEIAEKCDPARYPADLQEEAENLLALGIDVQFTP
jgi:hypothetical protein